MEQVALSPPKPRGSSLVPLHMTWLSRFESISSSTLAVWMPAKEAESRGGAGAGVRGIMWCVLELVGKVDRWKVCDKRNEGKWQHGAVQSDTQKVRDGMTRSAD